MRAGAEGGGGNQRDGHPVGHPNVTAIDHSRKSVFTLLCFGHHGTRNGGAGKFEEGPSAKESNSCVIRGTSCRQVKQNANRNHHVAAAGMSWGVGEESVSQHHEVFITFAEASKKVHSLFSHHVERVGGDGRRSDLLSFDNLSPHRHRLEHELYPSVRRPLENKAHPTARSQRQANRHQTASSDAQLSPHHRDISANDPLEALHHCAVGAGAGAVTVEARERSRKRSR